MYTTTRDNINRTTRQDINVDVPWAPSMLKRISPTRARPSFEGAHSKSTLVWLRTI